MAVRCSRSSYKPLPSYSALFHVYDCTTEIFLRELREKHDVDDALFLVDDADWLQTALQRHGLDFRYERHGNRHSIERIFREIKRRTSSFSNCLVASIQAQLKYGYTPSPSGTIRQTKHDPSKGQITIPSRLREEFGLERGTKLMVVPTDYGIVLKKIELPSVTEFQERVSERADETELSLEDVNQLVHEARESDE